MRLIAVLLLTLFGAVAMAQSGPCTPGKPPSLEQARENLKRAQAAYAGALKERTESLSKYAQYSTLDSAPHLYDGPRPPPVWNAEEEKRLYEEVKRLERQSGKALDDLAKAQREARDAAGAAAGAKGKGGFPPPNRPPPVPPADIGNAKTEPGLPPPGVRGNTTPGLGPPGQTPGSVRDTIPDSGPPSHMETGAAGVADSFWPFPW